MLKIILPVFVLACYSYGAFFDEDEEVLDFLQETGVEQESSLANFDLSFVGKSILSGSVRLGKDEDRLYYFIKKKNKHSILIEGSEVVIKNFMTTKPLKKEGLFSFHNIENYRIVTYMDNNKSRVIIYDGDVFTKADAQKILKEDFTEYKVRHVKVGETINTWDPTGLNKKESKNEYSSSTINTWDLTGLNKKKSKNEYSSSYVGSNNNQIVNYPIVSNYKEEENGPIWIGVAGSFFVIQYFHGQMIPVPKDPEDLEDMQSHIKVNALFSLLGGASLIIAAFNF